MRRNHPPIPSLVLFLLTSAAIGQNPPAVRQEAKNSPCSNVVALTGDVKIDCASLTPAQQKIIESIPSLLRNIIAHQREADAVLARLDECLKAVNPNLPKKTYMCKGGWTMEGPSATTMHQMNADFGPDPSMGEMIKLNNAHQYKELLQLCTSQIESKPEWLTPRLFCALAYGAMADIAKAKDMLAIYDDRKGPAYDGDADCKTVSNFLHANLK